MKAVGTSNCDINALGTETDVLASGCYSGTLGGGFSVDLQIQDKSDDSIIFSTFDGISCTIGDSISVADLALTVTEPTFADITQEDTAEQVILTVIADGVVDAFPYSNVEFGSEVAVVAQLNVDSAFTATMSGCQVKAGEDAAVAP